jgi:hypothetical protein
VKQHFYVNTGLGSHGYGALGSNRGPFGPSEMPTIDSENESIVATNAFFIDRFDMNRSWGALLKFTMGLALSTLFFPISGPGQARDQQTLAKDLEEIGRVATILVDGDICQRIMTDRALKKMFVIDPKDPWAGSDNFDVNAEPYIQTKKALIRLARLVDYPVDCNLWMPFKEEPGKIQVLIRNKYEMSQFWSFGELYTATPPEMKEVLATGKRLTVQKRGNIISVLTPVSNSLGDIVGLVEVVSRVQFNPEENVK